MLRHQAVQRRGDTVATAAMDAAVVASIALQHGISIDVIRRALTRDACGAATVPLGTALDMLAA
jgi:hypothetical protein